MHSVLRFSLMLAAGLGMTALAVSDAGGLLFSDDPPLDRAAAPPTYSQCTQCHASFDLNSGDGSLSVDTPNIYVPNSTYTLTVTLEDPGQSQWGYELTATDENGNALGTLTNPDANSQIRTSGGTNLDFASHMSGGTFAGTNDGPVSWTVDWIAPAAGAGTAFFYLAGNGGDQASGPGGDYIYSLATASLEDGAGGPDATIIPQPVFPIEDSLELSRALANDRLIVELRVRNHKTITETYAVATRVKLPNGNLFPGGGGFITTNLITLDPGETGTISFNKPIKNTAPLGVYEFQALVGMAPSTLLDTGTFDFEVIP